ncbi:MAG: hypothetical protein AAGB35_07295 [Pseudomonadota bacterium]
MQTLLGKSIIASISLLYSCNLLAHPNHLFEIQNEVAHSHSGIEYLLVFTAISIAGIIIVIKKRK